MIVTGRFIAGAPNVTVNLSNPSFTGGFVRLLADTGASRTVLQNADFRRLAIPSHLLKPAPSAMVGVGGGVSASILPGVDIAFSLSTGGVHVVKQDIWVMPSVSPSMSLPSLLGRDVINSCEFKCDGRSAVLPVVQLDF